MSWVNKLYGRSISSFWWKAIGGVLALQIIARVLSWTSLIDNQIVQSLDVLTLSLLLGIASIIIISVRKTLVSLVIALMIFFIGAGLIYSLEGQNVLVILFCLAIAHNFTPVLLMQGTNEPKVKKLQSFLPLLFGLPILLFILLLLIPTLGTNLIFYQTVNWIPPEISWVNKHFPHLSNAALSTLVLAQCLHYYTVIRIIPASLGSDFKVYPSMLWAVLASGLLMVYFAFNFSSAKGFYAIAAGTHAWLEWTLIALIAGKVIVNNQVAKL